MALDSKQKEVELSQRLVPSTTVALPSNGEVAVAIAGEDSDSGDEECFARTQIKHLLWINTSQRHKKALEFWSAQDALCTRRVDSKRKQSLAVKNEVYQVIGFYSVFQGVLLTAVSQSNLLHCNNWWSAFSLSALASFVAFVGIFQKFRTVLELERTIESEKESRQLQSTGSCATQGIPDCQEILELDLQAASYCSRKPILEGRSCKVVGSSSTTMKTYIINETTQTFLLKEGNAGAFRMLGELKEKGHKNSKFTIKVDPNATYREYMVATGKKGKTIIITSDDFSEYEVIKIMKIDPPSGAPPGTPVTYKSVPSNPRKPSAPSNAGDGSSPAGSSNAAPGESAPGVSSAGGEAAPGGSSNAGPAESILSVSSNVGPAESIPSVSSNAGPAGQPTSGVSLNAGPVESTPGGSLNTGPCEPAPGGSNHVAWYKKYLFKSFR